MGHTGSATTRLLTLFIVLFISACKIDADTGIVQQDAPTPVPIDPITGIDDPRLRDPALGLSDAQISDLFADASCNALSQSGSLPITDGGDYSRGLLGKVRLPPLGFNNAEWQTLDKYLSTDAVEMPNDIYFSDVNIPTRSFDAGFPLMDGGLLKNFQNNQTVFEWFSLNFEGFLDLTSIDGQGRYEIAILADDGVRLKAGLEMQTILDSPTVHPSKLVCASSTIEMLRGYTLPIQLSYFQGPRYHIALQMFWRPMREEAEPLCGQQGNTMWYDYSQVPAVAKQPILDMKARGWKEVKPENFRLPNSALFNPCMSERVRQVLGWQ